MPDVHVTSTAADSGFPASIPAALEVRNYFLFLMVLKLYAESAVFNRLVRKFVPAAFHVQSGERPAELEETHCLVRKQNRRRLQHLQ